MHQSHFNPTSLTGHRWSFLTCVLSLAVLTEAPVCSQVAEKHGVSSAMKQEGAKPSSSRTWLGGLLAGKEPDTVTPPLKPVAQQHEDKLKAYFPPGPHKSTEASKFEAAGSQAVQGIFEEVLDQAHNFNAPELDHAKLEGLSPVPENFDASWKKELMNPIWAGQQEHRYLMDRAYATALSNSTQIRSFLRIPKVQEAIIRENLGLFDTELFAEANAGHTDQPTGSILTTGKTGRFLEDTYDGQYGLRQRLSTGAQLSLSQRLSTLKNNSEFLDPNPQSGSEVVLSVAQPLLRGAGSTYVRSEIRLAELDRDLAQGESLKLMEDYLLEVNRAYWGVYLSRAALVQRQILTGQTSELLKLLEARQKLDETATVSELFRATATMNRRQADMRRTRMAVRTAEQRLRAMIKDPAIPMGASGELIPVSKPYLGQPTLDIQAIAREALTNRSEMAQASTRVHSTAVQRSQTYSELKPQLDLVGEAGYAGIASGRSIGGAMDDQFDNDVDWRVGLRFSMPWGNTSARARLERREIEYQQALDDYRIQGENVLLQTLIAYQDLLTAYQDMAGKYQSALASRKEIQQLQERMKLADQDAGKTIAYQIQLLLDAIDRNQVAEEEFLVSIVAYNTSIAQSQRAQGVLLKVKDVVPLQENKETVKTSPPPPVPQPRKPAATLPQLRLKTK